MCVSKDHTGSCATHLVNQCPGKQLECKFLNVQGNNTCVSASAYIRTTSSVPDGLKHTEMLDTAAEEKIREANLGSESDLI